MTACLVTLSPSFALARYVRQTIVTAVSEFSWCSRGADGVRRQGGCVVVYCMLRWRDAWGGPRAQFRPVAQTPVPGGGGVDYQGGTRVAQEQRRGFGHWIAEALAVGSAPSVVPRVVPHPRVPPCPLLSQSLFVPTWHPSARGSAAARRRPESQTARAGTLLGRGEARKIAHGRLLGHGRETVPRGPGRHSAPPGQRLTSRAPPSSG